MGGHFIFHKLGEHPSSSNGCFRALTNFLRAGALLGGQPSSLDDMFSRLAVPGGGSGDLGRIDDDAQHPVALSSSSRGPRMKKSGWS